MSTVRLAIEAKRELQNATWEEDWENPDTEVRRVYLGSYMYLDPCGRFHHFLSPNGVTRKCEDFWDSLDRQVSRRGLSLEGGEGDPTDIFVCEYRAKEDDSAES